MELERRHTCAHPNKEERKKKGLSSIIAQEQCVDCAAPLGIPRVISIESAIYLPLWKYKRRPTKKKRDYIARLARKDWKSIRMRVLIRDSFTCRECGEEANEVDHISYESFGDESMSDLEAVCSDCQQIRRQRRIGS